MKYAVQNCMIEWSYRSAKEYVNPFLDVELNVEFTCPDGKTHIVPAFWASESLWSVRYSSYQVGKHQYRTLCSDTSNPELHDQAGELEVRPYEGNKALLKHGRLRVGENRTHLEHVDGTPFFWLGDTWWYGLVREFLWPTEFQELTADRVRKGFNLIQIVVGYLPAMPEGDCRGGNEAGLPWSSDYETINPGYFDMADLRIAYLVNNGLVPCIVGSWGYWLLRLGAENAKRHWRYIVARYGAYPVVWCLCGEVQCVYPDMKSKEMNPDEVKTFLRQGWSEVCRYLGQIDPYRHPITAHPNGNSESRDMLENNAPVSVAMQQTGHSFRSLPAMVKLLTQVCQRQPRLPVINGECVYESIFGSSWQDIQRLALWVCVLNGAAGHTYGAAEGGWHIHHRGQPPFPFTSGVWGEYEDWRDIAAFPGSGQMQFARRLLEKYAWWHFEPHPDWIEIKGENDNCFIPHVAGISRKVRIIYLPPPSYAVAGISAVVKLEPNVRYLASFYDPRSGSEHELGVVQSKDGRWAPPRTPNMQDWVIVMETDDARIKGNQ